MVKITVQFPFLAGAIAWVKSKSTAKNIFDELIKNGLINIAEDSHFHVKLQKLGLDNKRLK